MARLWYEGENDTSQSLALVAALKSEAQVAVKQDTNCNVYSLNK